MTSGNSAWTRQQDHGSVTSPPAPERREVSHVRGYTVEQVAEMLQIGRDKVYVLLRTGQLRSIKIGRSRRITDQHLAEFVSSLEQAS